MCGVCVEKGVSGRRQVLKETFGILRLSWS